MMTVTIQSSDCGSDTDKDDQLVQVKSRRADKRPEEHSKEHQMEGKKQTEKR